jgi:hypothetical protein
MKYDCPARLWPGERSRQDGFRNIPADHTTIRFAVQVSERLALMMPFIWIFCNAYKFTSVSKTSDCKFTVLSKYLIYLGYALIHIRGCYEPGQGKTTLQ